MAIESELKYQLTKEEYARLLRALKKKRSRTILQENFYFDTPSYSLQKLGIGLRIRIIDKQKAILTAKATSQKTAPRQKGYTVRKEWESKLHLKTVQTILKSKRPIGDLVAQPITQIKRRAPKNVWPDVSLFGSVRTRRTFAKLSDRLTVELDAVRMGNAYFYEVEVETDRPKETAKELQQWLKTHKVACRPKDRSKLARLISFTQKKKAPK